MKLNAKSILIMLGILGLTLPLHSANKVAPELMGVKAYPNPWRADRHTNTQIKFDGMPAGSN